MNVKIYEYHHPNFSTVVFKVDTDILPEERAKFLLEQFYGGCLRSNDVYKDLLKHYAIHALKNACLYDNRFVSEYFIGYEQFCKVDGSVGITLLDLEPFLYDEDDLSCFVIHNKPFKETEK